MIPDPQYPETASEESIQSPLLDEERSQESGEGDRALELVNSDPPSEEEVIRKPFVFKENLEPDEDDGDRTPKNTNVSPQISAEG